MAQFPALPLFTDAYLGDTSHLTTLEHGAYLLLLMAAWRSKNCDLPNDDKLLARFSRLRVDQWRKIKPIILEFFEIENNRLIQGRLQDEKSYVLKKSKASKKGARARWLKNKEVDDANASNSDMQSQSDSFTPTPTPTPTVNSKGHLDENDDVPEDENSEPKPPPKSKPKPDDKPMLEEAFDFYNKLAEYCGIPTARSLSDTRIKKLRRRIKDAGGLDEWKKFMRTMHRCPHLLGHNNRNWKANFDFFLQESSFLKFCEGSYLKTKPSEVKPVLRPAKPLPENEIDPSLID